MEELKRWAFSVAATVVFGTVAETALPGGDYKKYIHLALGLVLLLNLAAPIIGFVSDGGALLGEYAAEFDAAVQSTETDAAETEKMQKSEIAKIYKSTLESRIAAEIKSACGTAPISVSVETDEGDECGAPTRVTVSMPKGAARNAEAADAAAKITGLTPDKIILEET